MTEPRITVTESDRRAAAEASRRHVSPSIEQWIKDGVSAFHKFVPVDIGVGLEMNAIAIARARTMAAFEERCAAIRKAKRWMVNGVVVDIAGITHAALEKTGILVGRRIEDITDDDIRALVLAGWETKAP